MPMRLIRTTLPALALCLLLAAAPSVLARGGDDARVTRTGKCTKNSTWKLKLKREDGGKIETELEVDQNKAGVRWSVTLRRGSTVLTKTAATTRGRSGSFSLERLVANGAGTDTISATATRKGETCRAKASI
jgi:hypothetical protein